MPGSRETVILDPLFDRDGAAAMVELGERHCVYRTYGEHERIEIPEGPGLEPREDSIRNFLRTGGLRASQEGIRTLAARTSYFREEYAYGGKVLVPGIEPFLHHAGLVDGARRVHGREVIEPQIAYANLMVPGQELAVHTDVPEFRGANRKVIPQWLLVVMQHSGLFDAWRMHIATGIAWFSDGNGGALAYWPDGADAAPRYHPTKTNTAMVLDTDTVFHGVDRVADVDGPDVPAIGPGATLTPGADGKWELRDISGAPAGTYAFDELRFSVSWKAYCFADTAERDAWRAGSDDLALDLILDRLVIDLERRTGTPATRDPALGRKLIDEYVHFPAMA